MLKRIVIFISLVASPFFFMILVNELANVPQRSSKYNKEYCTRYCHNVTCLHFKASYNKNPTDFKKQNKKIFDGYVNGLHGNILGLNYKNINLLVFIIFYPVLGSFLLWNLIKWIK